MGAFIGGALWAATAAALAFGVHVGLARWWMLLVAAASLGVAIVVLGQLRSWPQLRDHRWRRAAVIALLTIIAASLVVTWRLTPLVDGPLTPLSVGRTIIEADVSVTSDPQTRQGRTSGSRRTDDEWQIDGVALSWRSPGSLLVKGDLPIRVLTAADISRVLPGTLLHVRARVLSADPMRGRAATLVAEELTILSSPPAVQRAAGAIRESLRESVRNRPPDAAGLLPGLVVGDTSAITEDLDRAMRDSGLAHLTAVSGGNVAVVVLVALGAIRLAGVRRGPAQIILVAAAVGSYVVLARPQPSVVRAAAMAAVVLFALLIDARIRPLQALGWSVGALVLLDPFLSLSIGFTMSVAATFALLLVASRWRQDVEGSSWPRRCARAVSGLVLVSAVAQVAVAPLVAGIGGGLPLGGVLANLLTAPAVAPATAFGLIASLLGLLWAPLAAVVAMPASWAVGWIATVARWTAESAGVLPWPSGWSGAIGLAGVIALGAVALVLARRRGGVLAKAVVAIGVAAGVLVVAPPTSIPFGSSWPPEGWRIAMCDVGQGDAVVLNAGAGQAVIVDVGPDPAAVDRCLRRLGVTSAPLLVLTHFHADHVEGLPGVLRGRPVGTLVVSPLTEPPGEQRRVLRWAHDDGLVIHTAAAGDTWRVGAVSLLALWPTRILRGQGSDPNNASVTFVAEVDGVSILLSGDLEPAAQDAVLASGVLGPVDVVKVPHHGSAKQSPGWVAATHPQIALVGVGLGNDYGHPSPVTVMAYRAAGAILGRTDLDGDLAVILDGNGVLGLVRRGA